MSFHHFGKQFSHLNIPLRWVLIVPFVVQIVGSVGLVGYLSYQSGQLAVENLANRLMDQATSRIYDHLNTSLAVQWQAVAVNYQAVQDGRINIDDLDQLRAYFWQQINLSPSLSSAEFADDERGDLGYLRLLSQESVQQAKNFTKKNLPLGTILFKQVILPKDPQKKPQRDYYLVDHQGNSEKLIYTASIDIRTMSWYQLGKASKQLTWSPIFVAPSTSLLSMKAIRPIYDATGKFQGIFSNSLPLSGISTFLSELNLSPGGKTFILERSGNLVATSTLETLYLSNPNQAPNRLPAIASRDPDIRAIALALKQKYLDFYLIPNQAQIKVRCHHDDFFVQVKLYRDQYGLDWLLVTAIPESDFIKEIKANTQGTIFLCGLALVVTIITGSWTAHWITKPILGLHTAAKKLTGKNFVAPVVKTPVGELRELTKSFTEMAEALQVSFAELANQKAYLAKLLETLPVGVAIHTPDGTLTYLNSMAYNLLGIKPIIGVNLNQLVSAYRVYQTGTNQPYPINELPAMRAVRGESCYVDDVEIALDDKRVVLEVRATPVFNQNEQVIYAIVVFEDITERQTVAKILANYNQKLEQDVWQRTIELEQEIQERQQIEAALRQAEVELRRANQALEHLVNTDGLTKIANRRYFNDQILQEWRRHLRTQTPLALIMIDIDYFKGYNDHYGHQKGDDCLIQVAEVISQIPKRSGDLVARYGGEEFVVILPNTDCTGALTVAESIQKAIASLAIPHVDSTVSKYVTLSLGVASLVPTSIRQPDYLIALADQALYEAKQKGRNRAIAFLY